MQWACETHLFVIVRGQHGSFRRNAAVVMSRWQHCDWFNRPEIWTTKTFTVCPTGKSNIYLKLLKCYKNHVDIFCIFMMYAWHESVFEDLKSRRLCRLANPFLQIGGKSKLGNKSPWVSIIVEFLPCRVVKSFELSYNSTKRQVKNNKHDSKQHTWHNEVWKDDNDRNKSGNHNQHLKKACELSTQKHVCSRNTVTLLIVTFLKSV